MAKKNRHARNMEQSPKKEAPVKEEAAPQQAAPAKSVVVAPPKEIVPKIDFDAWFVMRGSKIPRHHHKEIIKADFKGRGLGQYESLADFDAALKGYGINLA